MNFSYYMTYYFISSGYISGANEEIMKYDVTELCEGFLAIFYK